MRLPLVSHSDSGGIRWQNRFGGLNLCLGAGEGEIAGMENLTADHSPVLASREKRCRVRSFEKAGGLGAAGELFWVDGTDFCYGGEVKGQVSEGEKRFYCLNRYIVIWPDKLFYNTATEEFGSLEAAVTVEGETRFCDSTWEQGNRLEVPDWYLTGLDFRTLFSPGEALTITGAGDGFDRTAVVKEVGAGTLLFEEYCFPLEERLRYTLTEALPAGAYWFGWPGGSECWGFTLEEELSAGCWMELDTSAVLTVLNVYDENDEFADSVLCSAREKREGDTELAMDCVRLEHSAAGVSIARTVPDMEHLCQCDNRLWGVGGDSIYGCWLGNPKIWNNFDGTAACCWSVQVGSAGAFTGAFSYGGYPLFFKEDHIYRLYGTRPANYQLFDTETLGCESGSEKSFAVVGQTLYYKSRAGFAAYSGGVPRLIDSVLGTGRRSGAVAGTDGRKYYVSCWDGGQWSLLVYDSLSGLWHREDASRARDFVWHEGGLYMLAEDQLWQLGRIRERQGEVEEAFVSFCEFADFAGEAGGRTAPRRLHLRVCSEEALRVRVQYDSSGLWEEAAAIPGGGKGLRTVELIPRRCDHFRLRLESSGAWSLWGLGWEYESGSRR